MSQFIIITKRKLNWRLLRTLHWNFRLFFFQQSDDNSNTAELILPIIMVGWSFTIIFFYCHFGAMVCNQFSNFDDELCQCHWYLFPVEVQKLLLIFMSDSQQSTYIRGYGGILCTRDSFKNVIFLRAKFKTRLEMKFIFNSF